jgi:hypothetical protein
MFDLLPKSAVPQDVDLPEALRAAQKASRQLFLDLPESYERDSVLNALGRIGKASLKRKIRYRAEALVKALDRRLPDLFSVLDAAVDCRNHYVHGSPSRIDYRNNFDLVIFFTDTLEFVFGSSELLEAGWDIRRFFAKGTTMSHPYGAYAASYESDLRSFRARQLLAIPTQDRLSIEPNVRISAS